MIRVRTIFTGVQGAPYYSNLYFTGDTLLDAQEAHAKVATFWNNARTHIRAGTSITIQGDVPEIDPATGDITVMHAVTPVNWLGTDSGEMLPPATQALVQFKTGSYVGGRQIRGRMFIPAQMESDNVAGLLGSGYITFLNGLLTTLLVPTASGAQPVVWSRTHGVDPIVTSATTWLQWAVLRSRRD